MLLNDKGVPIKAFLDNAPSHPSEDELKSEDGQIVTMFLPANVTPLIQPIDQNVSYTFKKLPFKDEVINLMAAWNYLNPEIIKKCWRNLLDAVCLNFDDDKNVPLAILKRQWDNENSVSKSLPRVHLKNLMC